ncbi:hypothetical protein KCP70_16095 [Salmonella enterica subsp. enterica]|nr:hypothetical protein KCP70_16095 [Salmonella enterica subsp. enterica]
MGIGLGDSRRVMRHTCWRWIVVMDTHVVSHFHPNFSERKVSMNWFRFR